MELVGEAGISKATVSSSKKLIMKGQPEVFLLFKYISWTYSKLIKNIFEQNPFPDIHFFLFN